MRSRSLVTALACAGVFGLITAGCGATTTAIDPKLYGTWLWNGSKWSELAPSNEQGYAVVGLTVAETLWYWRQSGGLTDVDGTSWNGSSWLPNAVGQLGYPPGIASGRTPFVVDQASDQMLVADSFARTIWSYVNGAWKPLVGPEHWPAARQVVGATYDPRGDVVLLFCCRVGESTIETWIWNGEILMPAAPFPFEHSSQDIVLPDGPISMVPDDTGNLVAFGKQPVGPDFRHQPGYAWDGKQWIAENSAAVWPQAGCSSLEYDAVSMQTVCLSYVDGEVSTWIWRHGSWTKSQDATEPPPGCGMSNLVYDPELQGIVMTDLNVACVALLP